MKNITKYILFAGLLTLGLASCNDSDGITPAEITNLKSETRPGEIVLRWDKPTDETIEYVKVVYNDPRLGKTVTRLASIYSDSLLIPDTRARYEAYQFTVSTVSPTGDESSKQTISQKSEAATITTKVTSREITLTVDDLSTNAQEESEGPIKNLLDGDKGTFFHTDWHGKVTDTHWMQVNLKEELDGHYKFYYAPRNGSNNPIDMDLMGSTDGENWKLIKKFTKDEDGLPTDGKADYSSDPLKCPFPFSQIRLVVNETNSGKIFWTMSEFKFYDVTVDVFNPETDEDE